MQETNKTAYQEIKKKDNCSIITAVIKFIEDDYNPSDNILNKFKSDIFIVKYKEYRLSESIVIYRRKVAF